MTMVLMTCMALTRERERGTYENLLAMPATPLEIMVGKIAPYVVVGMIQSTVVLLLAKYVFGVPVIGSLLLLAGALTLFIIANLAVGYTFSTIAQKPVAGDADDGVLSIACNPAVRFCLSLCRHAGLGAGYWARYALHPFPAHRAWSSLKGQ